MATNRRPAALARLDEAFQFERSIDIATYGRHAGKLREELTLVRWSIALHRDGSALYQEVCAMRS